MQDIINKLIEAKAANHYRGMQKSLKQLRDEHGVKVVGRLNCKKAIMAAIAATVIASLLPINSPASFLEGEQAIVRAITSAASYKRRNESQMRALARTVCALHQVGEYTAAIAMFKKAF